MPEYRRPIAPGATFFFAVVTDGLRPISAGHDPAHIDRAVEAFTLVGKKYDILGKTKDQIIAKYGE